MKYRTQFLGPLFTATGGFIVGFGADVITLAEALQGISSVSTLMIAVMLFKWADME